MPKYSYVARNKAGEVSQGDMDAAEQREVVEALRKDGFWPTEISEIEKKKKNKQSFFDRFQKVPLKNKMILG